MQKAKTIGIEKYHTEQLEKKKILDRILNRYAINNRHIFFCLAVNLLEVDDLKLILGESDESTQDMTLNERSDFIKNKLYDFAKKMNISLELNTGKY